MENPFEQNPFREDDDIEDVEDARDLNPYTAMEGYEVRDASGVEVGRIEETVHDYVLQDIARRVVDGLLDPADLYAGSVPDLVALHGRVRV